MNRKYLSLGIAAVAIFALTLWLTYPADKPKSIVDPTKYHYLHCPKCDRETRYTPDAAEKPCAYCDKRLVPTEDSIKQAGASSPYNTMGIWLIVEIILLMGVTWLVARPRSEDPEANYLYINCPGCRQRIRYQTRQVGAAAMCRRCRHAFVYPEAEPD